MVLSIDKLLSSQRYSLLCVINYFIGTGVELYTVSLVQYSCIACLVEK